MMNHYLVDEKEIHNPTIGRRTAEINGPGSQRKGEASESEADFYSEPSTDSINSA